MTDVEAALARLRDLPVHPGLSAIDGSVLAALAVRPAIRSTISGAMFGFAATVALTLGFASALLPSAPVGAADIAPFGAPPALAPSTLLGASE
ncbi:hypothetical protein KNJ79_08860 [Sphingopyxis indica]|uniref:hypothetical protein n=1 Tax=Sphingopyxis indica TaxID=436663 RepID=UPI0029394699|nr:hypothetical protein [Sphingopyxis indica]WOF44967.1 hypothetical protein KNJ79_08860 [Sphingopyxis indica]